MPRGNRRKKLLAVLCGGALACCGTLAIGAAGANRALPDTFYITSAEEELRIASLPLLRVRQNETETAEVGGIQKDKSRNCTLTLLGVPVKTVRTVVTAPKEVQVCGVPFGVKMFSNGALVVAFSDQYTVFGTENPAKEAGLRLGDLIISADGHPVRNNEELSEAIGAAAGKSMSVVYLREGQEHCCSLTPVADRATGKYKAGVWVRDSSAGIGTMTFVEPEQQVFAGLGHSISDSDTGADIALLAGEIVPVSIVGSIKGAAGMPGELRGDFSESEVWGQVLSNDTTGLYGRMENPVAGELYPVARVQDIKLGEAQVLATIEGEEAKLYDARIERVNMTSADPNRNLLIHVTDEELLSATGGIVQGMSGSPVLQDGKLIGAITHVLVRDSSRGYGIFAETMLEKAKAVENQLTAQAG